MKAAVVESPNRLVVRELPMPELGEYDALCRLLYGATCSGTDQHIIRGTFPFQVSYPVILGHESIGRVERVGPKVRNYRVGDLVTRVGSPPVGQVNIAWGGFAEYGIARDHWAMKEDGISRDQWDRYRVNQVLAEGMDPAGATMIITWRETLSYITRLGVHPGDKVLVMGSGGNGLSFVAHARNAKSKLVALVGSADRRNEGDRLGVDAHIDYRTPDLREPLRKICPDGLDVIIDAVGKSGQLDRVLPCLKPGGTVGIYGVDDYFNYHITPNLAPGTFTFYRGEYDEEESHERVVEMIQHGQLRAADFCDLENTFTLDHIQDAFEAVKTKKAVKAVVRLS